MAFLQVIAIFVALDSVASLVFCFVENQYTIKQKVIRIASVVLIVSVCASSFVIPKALSKPKATTDTYWEEMEEQSNSFVYITDTGKCYHRGYCQYLNNSKYKISLTEAKYSGYRPCSVCNPPT